MFTRLLKKQHWKKLAKVEYQKAESFLLANEKYCVSACSRFRQEGKGHVWYIPKENGEISSLLIHSRRSLFPVFGKKSNIPDVGFLNRFPLDARLPGKTLFLGRVPIHVIQGLYEDARLLESLMENEGYFASERIDYELMSLEDRPKNKTVNKAPKGLILRPPKIEDKESLFALQSAYEQEEVLPKKSVFNPAASRLNLQHILSTERILVAELDGRIVGKINTNAESFNRTQIGGVYVHPDFRRLGIGAAMSMIFINDLLKYGKAITLFVKKNNIAACKVYRNIGFNFLADYRISYY